MDTASLLSIARQAAENAAAVLLNYFGSENKVQFKTPWNLVSEADVEAEAAIKRTILESFPDHVILGEESSDDALSPMAGAANDPAPLDLIEHLWIVDPLDGTNNFCHGVDQFAVSIAYYHKGIPTIGIVHRPTTGDWYQAVRGEGALENGKQCRVADTAKLGESMIGVGFYYDRGQQMRATLSAIEKLFEQNIRGLRRMGAASLDLCLVGTGRFGGYFEYTLAPWDYAAGKLFVEEAGGIVTDLSGNDFHHGHSGIVSAGAALHAKLLDVVGGEF